MDENIRLLNIEDWEAVSRIYQEGIESNISTFETASPAWDKWDSSHLENCRYVYTQNGKVVGWAALTPVSSRCVYSGVAEISVYVANEAKRKGVGMSLIKKLIEESEKNGIWTLQSGILQENIASIGLHIKCGFREVGYREKIGKDRYGVWRNTVLMERRSSLERFA